MTTPEPGATGPSPDGLRPVDVLTVVSVEYVTPTVRRVLLAGTPAGVAAAGPTVSLLVPRVGDPAPRWPRVAKDGRIVWPEGAHGVSLRSYTARRQDPARGEVEIDFVLHGDGPAAAWAAAAAPGDPIGSAGGGPLGDRPAHRLLLAGDETALPAISRILAAAPDDTGGVALIEVAGPEEEQPLPAPAGITRPLAAPGRDRARGEQRCSPMPWLRWTPSRRTTSSPGWPPSPAPSGPSAPTCAVAGGSVERSTMRSGTGGAVGAWAADSPGKHRSEERGERIGARKPPVTSPADSISPQGVHR